MRISDKLQLLVSTFGSQGIRILATLVTARYIGPADNGAFFEILALAGIFMALGDINIPAAMVQVREFPEKVVIDSAQSLLLIINLLYATITIGAARYLSIHDHDGRLLKVGILIALSNLLNSVYTVQLATLNRRMHFRAESAQNIIFAVSSATAGIVFAVLHWGVYAIALQILGAQIVANIFMCFRIPPRLPRHASLAAAKRLLWLGAPISFVGCITTIEGAIVNLTIKIFSGIEALGLWGKQLQVQQMFAQNAMAGLQRVAYPTLCSAAGDAARTRTLFIRINAIVLLASAYFMAVLGGSSHDIVAIVLGPMWAKTVPLLRISALAIPAGALTSTAYSAMMSTGSSKSLLWISVINFVIFIPLVYLCRGYGVFGLACCWTGSKYFISLSQFEKARQHFKVAIFDVLKTLFGALFCGAITLLVIKLVTDILIGRCPLPVRFCLANAAGAGAFAIVAFLTQRQVLTDAMRMAVSRMEVPTAPPPPSQITVDPIAD